MASFLFIKTYIKDNSAELKEAFKIFDRDGNGYIDAEELKKVKIMHL